MAGFYINSIGVIQWSSSLSSVNIGNVFNVIATGNILTSGNSHVGAGNGSPGGYYLGTTQIITGAGAESLPGSITVNTALTNTAGYYIQMPSSNPGGLTGITGVIQYATGSPATINIGNVYNITASGDIVTSYAHHVDAGYYMAGGLTVINATGSIIANTTLTNYAGYYMQMPAVNAGGYTGLTGVIQYATGSPAVIDIGHVQDITAGGTIFTTGHMAVTPATDIVALNIIGATGGSADLLNVQSQAGGAYTFSLHRTGLSMTVPNDYTGLLGINLESFSDTSTYTVMNVTAGRSNIYASSGYGAALSQMGFIVNSGGTNGNSWIYITEGSTTWWGFSDVVTGTFTCTAGAKTHLNFVGGVFVGCS